jgi:hypothetical protein
MPVPITDPEATWVVERANPRWVDARIVAVVAASAANPRPGSISVSPLPRARMMRQPPVYVPIAIAGAQTTITQSPGPVPAFCEPAAMRVRVITPMVFCASFVPWARETSDEVNTCP